MLDAVKDELFPVSKNLKELLIDVQKYRIKFPIFSKHLSILENRYEEVSKNFYAIVKKLETPDDLFEGLENNPQDIASYFQFQPAISKSIQEASKYIEIIDRTLDRKRERIQNFRTLLLAVIAIIVSVFF